MSKEPIIEIHVGESGTSFASRNSSLLEIDRQPAGLNFYKIWFPVSRRGGVTISAGTHKISLHNVVNILASEDVDLREEGLQDITINSTLTATEKISHDEARLLFFALLQDVVRSGWKATIPLSMARLRGKEIMQYFLSTNQGITLDPSYTPTLKEWMQLENMTSWNFYASNTYMNITFMREGTLLDPTKPGSYLVSTEIKSDIEELRNHVENRDRTRSKELVPDVLHGLAATRKKLEGDLRKRGMTIDESYIDPPVPAYFKK